MEISRERSGLILGVLAACFLFMYLISNIPTLELNHTDYGDNFLLIVAFVFTTTALVGSNLSLKKVIPILLLFVFISPLTNVTNSGWYNVPSTGLLFGTLFQIRPRQIHLQRNHVYLFGTLIALGLYYNLVPAFFGDNDGFNNKLWLYNLSTFLKYIYIALLLIQVQPSTKRLFKYVTWFALFLTTTIILDAFHIPQINVPMKVISQMGYRPLEASNDIALHYWRAAGISIDANHAATRLAIILPIVLSQFKTFKFTVPIITLMLVGIFLTGSRSGVVLTLIAIIIWLAYDRRQFWAKYQTILQAGLLTFFLLIVFNFNSSVSKVEGIASGRYSIFLSEDKQQKDQSFLFRQSELRIAVDNITPFGDRTDHLSTVHSEVSRLIRFYGILGVTATFIFWGIYMALVRRNYIAFTVVLMMAVNSFWKWTFHIEAFFIPTIVLATLYLSSRKTKVVDK